ncbi:MAG: GGDEF domain-containing protein, partial [Actinomycetota bacterium]
GPAAGDEVLRRFGAHLNAARREGDAGIRYGGDAFLLLLRGAGSKAPGIVERIRLQWLAGTPPVGFSAGVAAYQSGQTAAEMVAHADEVLYIDKRNRKIGSTVTGSIS